MTITKRKPPVKTAPARAAKGAKAARKMAPTAPRYSEQYEKALKEYERGVQLVQKKNFSEAAQVFAGIIATSEDEREICDRARHYLSICREKLEPTTPQPTSVEDHFHLGVFYLNRADVPGALGQFEKALRIDPKSDLVHYGIASAHALAGETSRAVSALQEAIRLNEKNRVHAQNDADFDKIRDEHEFIQLVEPEEAGAN